jgi:hypothetical protein
VTHAIGRDPVARVALSAGGRWLAACCANDDRRLIVRPARDAAAPAILVHAQNREPHLAFFPDRPLLAVADSNYLKVFDPGTPEPPAPRNAFGQRVSCEPVPHELEPLVPDVIYPIGAFAFAADGRTVFAARSKPYVSVGRAGVQCWEVAPGVPPTRRWAHDLSGTEMPPRGLGLLPGEDRVAVVEREHSRANNGYAERVVVFDAATGARRYELPAPAGVPGPNYDIDLLAVCPRAEWVAGIVCGALTLWPAAPGATADQTRLTRGAPVRAAAFHPDGRTLFVATWDEVVCYDLLARTFSPLPAAVPGRPCVLAVAPDGRALAVGTMEGTVTVCDC